MILQHALHSLYKKSYWIPWGFGLVLWLVLTEISLNNFTGPWPIIVGISGAFALLAIQSLIEWARIVDAPEPTLAGFFLEWFAASALVFTFIAWFFLTILRLTTGHPGGLVLSNWYIWIAIALLSGITSVVMFVVIQIRGFFSFWTEP